jgi:hypothetical protein
MIGHELELRPPKPQTTIRKATPITGIQIPMSLAELDGVSPGMSGPLNDPPSPDQETIIGLGMDLKDFDVVANP